MKASDEKTRIVSARMIEVPLLVWIIVKHNGDIIGAFDGDPIDYDVGPDETLVRYSLTGETYTGLLESVTTPDAVTVSSLAEAEETETARGRG